VSASAGYAAEVSARVKRGSWSADRALTERWSMSFSMHDLDAIRSAAGVAMAAWAYRGTDSDSHRGGQGFESLSSTPKSLVDGLIATLVDQAVDHLSVVCPWDGAPSRHQYAVWDGISRYRRSPAEAGRSAHPVRRSSLSPTARRWA
jgi:hypothetical protein